MGHYPDVRVIVMTRHGVRSVEVADLLPLATGWTISDGSSMA